MVETHFQLAGDFEFRRTKRLHLQRHVRIAEFPQAFSNFGITILPSVGSPPGAVVIATVTITPRSRPLHVHVARAFAMPG